jgi:Helicase conserved C-terminal domain
VGIGDNPKGKRLAENVARIYRERGGCQLIFSDRVESQAGIKALLVTEGIPEDEIDIVNAATAPNIDDRLAIQDRYNAGETRVLIGGAVASEGMDLQRDTTAIHFNNLAWEGLTIHQRKGRGVRQGNRNDEVAVFYYLLEGSTDNYRFLTTQNKTHWWSSLRGSQTEAVQATVFSNPMSDELIASLADDPETIIDLLREQRKAKALGEEIRKCNRLLCRMLSFANPYQRLQGLPLLQAYEAKIRGLEWIPQELVDEAMRRVQLLANFQARRRPQGSEEPWETWVRDVKPLFRKEKVSAYWALDLCLGLIEKEGTVCFEAQWEDLMKSEFLRGPYDIPSTFGKEIQRDRPAEQALMQQSGLEVVIIEEPLPPVKPSIQPKKPEPVPKVKAQAIAANPVQLSLGFQTEPCGTESNGVEKLPKAKTRSTAPPKEPAIPVQLSLAF